MKIADFFIIFNAESTEWTKLETLQALSCSGKSPLKVNGHPPEYVFINRRCTIVRMLHYERGFYVLYEKRPEQGRFKRPVYDSNTGKYKISYADLVCLTEGLQRTEIRLPEDGYDDSIV